MKIVMMNEDLKVLYSNNKLSCLQDIIGAIAANETSPEAITPTADTKEIVGGITKVKKEVPSKAPEKAEIEQQEAVNKNIKETKEVAPEKSSESTESNEEVTEEKRTHKEMFTALNVICKKDKEARNKVKEMLGELGISKLSDLTDEQISNICNEVGC